MRKHVTMIIATVAILLALTSVALCGALAPEPALALDEQPTGGVLAGNPAGSFDRYEVAYPVGGTELYI